MEEVSSPSVERRNTLIGIASTLGLAVCVVGLMSWGASDSVVSTDPLIVAEREATLEDLESKVRRASVLTEWINEEDKIARIPIDSAVDLVLQKYQETGDISFSGDAVPTVGTKLTTGPFTLVEIPPLTQNPARDAEILAMVEDPAIVEEGYYQYEAYCLQCHGGPGMPGEGPTVLFDGEWYYASTPSQMEQLIWKGIIQKGMPPWEGALPPEVTGAMVAYMLANQPE